MIGLLILIRHLLLSGMWFHVAPRMDAKHTYGLEEIGLYSQHIIYKHSRVNSQHNWGNIYDHLMSTIIFK